VYELSRLGRTFYETLRVIQELDSPIITVSDKEKFLQNLDPQVRKLVITVLVWATGRKRSTGRNSRNTARKD